LLTRSIINVDNTRPVHNADRTDKLLRRPGIIPTKVSKQVLSGAYCD